MIHCTTITLYNYHMIYWNVPWRHYAKRKNQFTKVPDWGLEGWGEIGKIQESGGNRNDLTLIVWWLCTSVYVLKNTELYNLNE